MCWGLTALPVNLASPTTIQNCSQRPCTWECDENIVRLHVNPKGSSIAAVVLVVNVTVSSS